jgi:hypothetical protein
MSMEQWWDDDQQDKTKELREIPAPVQLHLS